MKIYKFGGASVASPSLVNGLIDIVSDCNSPLVVVISAIGKTTNALEKIVFFYVDHKFDEAKKLFKELEEFHETYINTLFGDKDFKPLLSHLKSFYSEIEWILDEKPVKELDYYYDQIVSIGELLSTSIVAHYMQANGHNVKWLDIRDYLRTDDTYRDAKVDIEYSKNQVKQSFLPILNEGKIIITQGYIGSTDQNENTTLGREGSDYTASLLGGMLDAQNVSIWKDVKGLMNADPRLDSNAIIIPEISYSEVIEMAYYGAQVIHPKTIKPLFNARIPMYVKCFLDKNIAGTLITSNCDIAQLPPIKVVKGNQIMVRFTTSDFSFFDEKNLSLVYDCFDKLNIKQNLTKISAISLRVVVDDKKGIQARILNLLSENFKIEFTENLTIHTIRHYNLSHIQEIESIPNFKLLERTPLTVQYVV